MRNNSRDHGRAVKEQVSPHFSSVGGALTKLLLAVEPEVADDNNDLANQCYPEWRRSHRTSLQTV